MPLCTEPIQIIVVSSPFSMFHEPDRRHRYASKQILQTLIVGTGLVTTLLPKRLIRATRLHMPPVPLRLSLRVIRQRDPIPHRAAHALVATGLLYPHASSVTALVSLALRLCVPQSSLVVFMVRVAAARATADAKEPEQCGGYGEGCC